MSHKEDKSRDKVGNNMNITKSIMLLVVLTIVLGIGITSATALPSVAKVHQNLKEIIVSPDGITVIPGNSYTFVAAGVDQHGDPMVITPVWSISREEITSLGVFNIGKYVSPGVVTITADASSKTDTATVTVATVKSISTDIVSVDFGDIGQGETSSPVNLVVTNEGNVGTNVEMSVSDLTYDTNIISGSNIGSTTTFPQTLLVEGTVSTGLALSVPLDTKAGDYTGTITFSTT